MAFNKLKMSTLQLKTYPPQLSQVTCFSSTSMHLLFITDNTQGTHCEFCIPGTFGNATTAQGCQRCKCNGHGDPEQGFCDMVTGKCFCTNDTMGDSCGECKPGLKGNPM